MSGQPTQLPPGRYMEIRKRWKDGERETLAQELGQSLRWLQATAKRLGWPSRRGSTRAAAQQKAALALIACTGCTASPGGRVAFAFAVGFLLAGVVALAMTATEPEELSRG